MDFSEKLKNLRKSKNLTQEELAEALFVSRTAVSKWESGRGYPGIESLKEISDYFSVTIDDLLSGEKLLSLAEKENNRKIRNVCNFFFGVTDLLIFLLIILPLYPCSINGFVFSVNLFSYTTVTQSNLIIHWIMFISLIVIGMLKLLFIKSERKNTDKVISFISIVINIFLVLFLSLMREAYAIIITFLFLIIKIAIFFICIITSK